MPYEVLGVHRGGEQPGAEHWISEGRWARAAREDHVVLGEQGPEQPHGELLGLLEENHLPLAVGPLQHPQDEGRRAL
eukprot:5106576-Alexandrium_andersonii.AAC.1